MKVKTKRIKGSMQIPVSSKVKYSNFLKDNNVTDIEYKDKIVLVKDKNDNIVEKINKDKTSDLVLQYKTGTVEQIIRENRLKEIGSTVP